MEPLKVGLRELRQDASGLLKRVEAGEEFTVTVSGRDIARLTPTRQAQWRPWSTISDLFSGYQDGDWADDRELIEQSIGDPWERQ